MCIRDSAYPDAPSFNINLADTTANGTYRVEVTIGNCSNISEPADVDINEIPSVTLGYNLTVTSDCSISELELTSTVILGTGTNITYDWSGPNGFSSNQANPIIPTVNSTYNGSYILEIIDENGCSINETCLLYTSPSPRDATLSRMPSSA